MVQGAENKGWASYLAGKAGGLRKSGNFAAAMAVWDQLVSSERTNMVWKLRLVESAARARNAAEARAAAAKVGAEAGSHAKILIATANALVNASCFEDAERFLGYLGQAHDSDPDRLFLLGRVHQRTGRMATALDLFNASIAHGDSRGRAAKTLDALAARDAARRQGAADRREAARLASERAAFPDFDGSGTPASGQRLRFTAPAVAAPLDAPTLADAEALVAQARVLTGKSDFTAARAVLQQALARNPASFEARFLLSQVFHGIGDRTTAQAWLRGALAQEPNNMLARRDLARSLQAGELWEDAILHWQILADAQATEVEPRLQLARCHFRAGQFVESGLAFQSALAIDPDNETCLVGNARALAAQDDPAAVQAWLAVMRRNSDNVEALTAVIKASVHFGLHDQVGALLESHLAKGARTPFAMLMLARSRIARGRFDAAEAVLADLLRDDPNAPAPLLELARLHQKLSHWPKALLVWQQLRFLQPENLEALRGLTHAMAKSGEAAGAIALWQRRAEAAPENSEPHLRIARLHVQLGQRDLAEACLRKAIALEPGKATLTGELAGLLAGDAARRLEALELCDRWVALEPDSAQPHLRRSQLFVQLGQPGPAERALEQALELAPDDPAAARASVQFLMRAGRYEDAMAPLDRWVKLAPSSVEPYLTMADAFARLSRQDDAEKVYRTLLETHPENEQALNGIARICRNLRRIDEAVSVWRRAIAVNPANAEAWTGIVVSLANADREAEALAEFESAQKALGFGPEARLAFAIMMDTGRFNARAPDAYLRALEALPGDLRVRRRFGAFLRREGNMDGALVQLTAARELDPAALDLALETIDVVEGVEFAGGDAWAISRGNPRGGTILFPELLFARLREIAATGTEAADCVPGRVILINQSLAAGGAERQLVVTARGLADPAAGLESVTLFCTSIDPRTGRDFYLPHVHETGIEIVLPDEEGLARARADDVAQAHDMLIRNLPEELAAVRFWLSEFRARRPEVVHAWQDMTCLTAVVAALLAGVPKIILGTRSVRPDNPRRRLRRWMQSAYADVLRNPRVTMMNNSRAGAADYADWIGIDPAAIKVVYNGIDFDALAARQDPAQIAAIREELAIPDGARIVGGVFRMSEEKRPLLFVQTAGIVASLLPDVHFVVCGDGPMAREMRELAVQLGFSGRLHMPGNQGNISNWFALMHCVLLTSRHEGLPNVLLEAQSFGIPVVVPAVGGAPEVVLEGKTGFAVADADAQRLADKVMFCLEDHEWHAEAQIRAARFVRENFSIPAMVAKTLAVYAGAGATAPAAARLSVG